MAGSRTPVAPPDAVPIPGQAREVARRPAWTWWLDRFETAGLSLLLVVVGWPVSGSIRIGLDPSWQSALHRAIDEGLRFGRDIVYTYGPLGFLSVPAPFVGPSSAIAFVASGAVYLGLVATTLVMLRRVLPLPAAVLVTFFVLRLVQFLEPSEAFQALVFMLAVEVIAGRRNVPWVVVAAGSGVLAGIAILGKANVGVFAAAMALVTAVNAGPRWPQRVALFLASCAISALGLWLATGQRIEDIAPFARATIEIAGGYSQAMGTDRDPALFRWIYLAYGVVAVLLAGIAWRLSSRWRAVPRVELWILVALLLFLAWKTSFVRGNPAQAFALTLFGSIALLDGTVVRWRAIAVVAWLAVMIHATSGLGPATYADVGGSVRAALVQARDALLPWRWAGAEEHTEARLRDRYAIPPPILTAIGKGTVHVDPSEAAVVTAYPELNWRPEPVFQSYSAYTPYLDELNAALLRSSNRPSRILRNFTPLRVDAGRQIPLAVDGRFYWFESPVATVERLCRYRELVAAGDWQVLADTGRACGPPRAISTVSSTTGEQVPVPGALSPNDLVIVRVHLPDEGLLGRIRTALWKAPEWYVGLDGFDYRLVPGTAGDGLVLAVPASAQGSRPFAFGAPVETIAVHERGSDVALPVTYEFQDVPLPPAG